MMTEPNENVLAKVRKLIALAADAGATDQERELALARADQMMTRHDIDEAMLAARAPFQAGAPEHKRARLYEFNNEFHQQFVNLVYSLAVHHRIRAIRHIDVLGEYTIVGYPADLEYFELTWTQVYLAFIARMEPKWRPAESEDSNIYRLKSAGIKWERIATLGGLDWPDGGRLKRAYRRECARLGETPVAHTQRHKAYRLSYAEGFIARIAERTARQTEARNETVSSTPGAEVALRDRAAYVDDLVYKLFPSLRPATAEELARYRAQQAKEAAELHAMLEAMTPAEREAFEAKARAADARWTRHWRREEQKRASMVDYAGTVAGRTAADSVDLSVGKPVGNRQTGELG
jgi:hypothetical protein